jgi:hypothetical protein
MKRLPRPDDEAKPFIVRWNTLCRILLVESSVKLVARSAVDFANFDNGSSCHPSNERIARETGYSEKAVRFAWSAMRGMGMAERVGNAVSYRRIADEYCLLIPSDWETLPVLGPYARKFTCLGCGKLFIPQGNCSVNAEKSDPKGGDAVRFDLSRLCFCAPPRAKEGRSGDRCVTVWNKRRVDAGQPTWGQMSQDRWDLFREARGDDW